MSTPLVNVTLGGKEKVSDVVEDIKERVLNAAAKATYEGAVFHTEMAKKNVIEAYTSAGYEPISFMYAKWLVQLDASAMNEILTDEEISERAENLQKTKQSMIFTGNLIAGIGIQPISIEGNKVIGAVVSSSPYSGDLERGYLFGKRRPGKQRPFFTGHDWQTEQEMMKAFIGHLKGERF